MSHLRTLVTLPIAAAAAFLAGTTPATAAPVPTAPATAAVHVTPSPILNVVLGGACPKAGLESLVAMQRINWMWAPLALDNADGLKPLPKVLIPNTIEILGDSAPGWRARHDFVGQSVLTAPGPKPSNPTSCTLRGLTADGLVSLSITGTVVTIPAWLDALLPPIQPPANI